ncbi:MAG: hypothetical protein CW342_10060 [Thermoactinomycetaceae bacterium]|nr:hypothetical protein [Thermoactinomycetaceae bacterium]
MVLLRQPGNPGNDIFLPETVAQKKNRNSRNRRADPEKCAAGSPLHPARPDRRRRAGARLDDISRPTDSSGIYCGLLPVQPVHPVGGAGRREAKIRAADKSGFKSCDPARLCVIICTIIRNIVPARRRSLPHPDTREEDPALSPFISALRLIDRYFILWLLIVSCIAYFFPSPFTGISPWIPLLLGVVMFGMGTTLSADDFRLILKQPVPVLIGVAAQYVIMPGSAFLIALLFRLPPDLAAGMILVGASPGGTASNVIVYLARGDVPLSVTMTTVSTLLAPIFTPLLMLLLADRWLPVEPWSLFQSIVQVVIVPVVLGILVKRFFPVAVKKATPALPAVSVLAIIAIVAGIIANGADQLLAAPIIFLAVMLHNLAGLALGYLAARLLRQDEARCRAISVEVGMQNSGLAVALATAHFNPIAALPGAIFSVWHNISGSLLAAYWGKKKIEKASASGMTADS